MPVLKQTCPRQPLSQLHSPAKCFLRRSRLPFARPQTPQTPLQVFPRQQLSQHMPQPCVSKGVQSCRLPALKPLNRPARLSKATTFAATGPSQAIFTAFEAAVCSPSNPQTPQTLPQAFPRQQVSQHFTLSLASRRLFRGNSEFVSLHELGTISATLTTLCQAEAH